ncbi:MULTISPECIES: hypothetical protein [Actinomadura]|uniref:hypothetical protein n=1 Tax=Actinomadura TaxID=1988 RepID=UPI0030CE1CE8
MDAKRTTANQPLRVAKRRKAASGHSATEKLSATIRRGRKAEIREQARKLGLSDSAYVDEAIAAKLQLDALAEFVDELEEQHGAFSEDEIQAALAAWPSAQDQ